MTFEEKYQYTIKELEISKIRKSNYNPPLFKLIHAFGFKVPLPHYNSFFNNVLLLGSGYGILMGILFHFIIWKNQNISLSFLFLGYILLGLTFGLIMASVYKYSAFRNKLTSWDKINIKTIIQGAQ